MRLHLLLAEEEAETTRHRQGLLVGREELQQLELSSNSLRAAKSAASATDHSRRGGEEERRKDAIAALERRPAAESVLYEVR